MLPFPVSQRSVQLAQIARLRDYRHIPAGLYTAARSWRKGRIPGFHAAAPGVRRTRFTASRRSACSRTQMWSPQRARRTSSAPIRVCNSRSRGRIRSYLPAGQRPRLSPHPAPPARAGLLQSAGTHKTCLRMVLQHLFDRVKHGVVDALAESHQKRLRRLDELPPESSEKIPAATVGIAGSGPRPEPPDRSSTPDRTTGAPEQP